MTLLTHSAPAGSLPVSRRLARAAVEFLPPMAVALLILPYIIKDGRASIVTHVYRNVRYDMRTRRLNRARDFGGWRNVRLLGGKLS